MSSGSTAAEGVGTAATMTSAAAPASATNARETVARNRCRLDELRASNLAAWSQGRSVSSIKLDTSLKRHTSLLTRLRSSLHTSLAVAGILKDIDALSLAKYVEEAVGAVIEGLGKCKSGVEVAGAVEIVSALHRRFPDLFTPPFTVSLLQNLRPARSTAADRDIREKEDQARIIRQRGFLRVLGELELAGIVVGKERSTGEVSWATLRELLTADKESLALAAPLAISFIKHLGPMYLPPDAQSHDFPAIAQGSTGAVEIVSLEMKDKFRKLCVAFVDALMRQEGRDHLELQRVDKRNHEAYIRSGEIFEDRSKNYEKGVKAWERGWSSAVQLAELLALPTPALPSLTTISSTMALNSANSMARTGEEIGGPGSRWADEEEKIFYEELRELKGEVPGAVLGNRVDRAEEKIADEVEAVTKDEEMIGAEVEEEELHVATENSPVAAADSLLAAGPAAKLSALFARLNDASSKNMIDSIAIEFAFLNSKAARKRLVKFLGSVNRNRSDILPYYSRLVATLDPFMPDIAKDLIALLEEEFRYLQRKKSTDMAETRSKNLRFFSELTKFNITPHHSILHVFRVLLDDLSGPNITNLCTVLEGCGRFLLRSEATAEKMMGVLEIVKRKIKVDTTLDVRQITELENAYYQCDPPDRPIVVPKVRSTMQLYMRELFYHTLSRNSVDSVLKLTRKLHWEDDSVVKKLHSAFTKVWKIKYSNIHLFAILLFDLGRYHSEFNVGVIDEVLENVRIGMEINSFKYNQQRVATVKYLGELYNYRVIDSKVIFDTLWSLVTFGHPEGRPHPHSPSPIDSPDDCFRVRLVCTLLDTCGSCFQRGMLKKKLDAYLGYFQMYILSKAGLPMDVEFMVSDTFELLRPKMVLHKTFLEAAIAVDELVSKISPLEEEVEFEDGVRPRAEGETTELDDHAAHSEEEMVEGEDDDDDDDGESDATITHDDDEIEESDSEDERSRPSDPNAITQEEEDDFNRELLKMISNTTASSSSATTSTTASSSISSSMHPSSALSSTPAGAGLLDVNVPYSKRRNWAKEDAERELEREEGIEQKGLRFTLMTKRGKNQNLSLEIPLDSAIAMNTLSQRAADKKEQQEMKRLVLDYEVREHETEKKAFADSLARRGIALRYTQPKATPYVAPPHPTSL